MKTTEQTEGSCDNCKGLGVVYIGLTFDELYWKTADCALCGGTGRIE